MKKKASQISPSLEIVINHDPLPELNLDSNSNRDSSHHISIQIKIWMVIQNQNQIEIFVLERDLLNKKPFGGKKYQKYITVEHA